MTHVRRRKFHPLVDGAISIAARGAMLPVSVAGYASAMRGAAVLSRVYARAQPKYRVRATANLRDAYPDASPEWIDATAAACQEHMFQLGVEFIFTPRLISPASAPRHLIFGDVAHALRGLAQRRPTLLITGHIGNWELVGYSLGLLGVEMAAVYRPLDARGLDRWVKRSREAKGLALVSKFGAARALPKVIEAGYPVGLVADQSGGDRGVFTPFFGRLTSTYKLIALLAMRFEANVICGVARRLPAHDPGPRPSDRRIATIGLGGDGPRFAVEVTDSFGPADWAGRLDPVFYITARYRRAMEAMIRRAPEQYFWMHRIWRSRPQHERENKPFPPALREKLLSLPWMTPADVDAVVERSMRDAATQRLG